MMCYSCTLTHTAYISSLLDDTHHPVHHQLSFKCALHSLEANDIAQRLVPNFWSRKYRERIVNACPNRVSPRDDRLFRPIIQRNGCSWIARLDESTVLFNGNEIRVRPLVVQKLELRLFYFCQRRRRLALTPSC